MEYSPHPALNWEHRIMVRSQGKSCGGVVTGETRKTVGLPSGVLFQEALLIYSSLDEASQQMMGARVDRDRLGGTVRVTSSGPSRRRATFCCRSIHLHTSAYICLIPFRLRPAYSSPMRTAINQGISSNVSTSGHNWPQQSPTVQSTAARKVGTTEAGVRRVYLSIRESK